LTRSEPIAALDTERDARIEALIEHSRLQDALIRMLSDRITAIEGLDPGPDHGSMTTLKGAAFMTGYSQSGIRRRISAGKIKARRVGGRWFVDASSLKVR
jgi:hypothetical protein